MSLILFNKNIDRLYGTLGTTERYNIWYKQCYRIESTIINRDMVWRLGEFQSVYNELWFNVETASPCTNLLKFSRLIFQQYGWVIRWCDAIGRLLHYAKNSLSSPCTNSHKHEQTDKTKTLVKYPDHIFIDFESAQQNCKITVCVFPLLTMERKILHRIFQYNYIAIQSPFYILLCECKGKGMTANKV